MWRGSIMSIIPVPSGIEVFSILIAVLGVYDDLRKKYTIRESLLLLLIFPDAKRMVEEVERHILHSTSNEPAVFRRSIAEDCTMLAVAAAIVAQVAITALSLEDIDQVHWTASAAFVLSLTTGGLSVFYACLIQQKMNKLFSASDVKDFFTEAGIPQKLRILEQEINGLRANMESWEPGPGAAAARGGIEQAQETISSVRREGNIWESASLPSILMVAAPSTLLKYALGSFVTGLGVYFGCLAFQDIETQKPRSHHRAVFIVYIVATLLGLSMYYVPLTIKHSELSSLLSPFHRWTWYGAANAREVEATVSRIQEITDRAREVRELNQDIANQRRPGENREADRNPQPDGAADHVNNHIHHPEGVDPQLNPYARTPEAPGAVTYPEPV
ncbi:uncharacterized protein APUU_21624A [Aspergillus puulaauensis]|uniref:Uncharacterized protein n=1 Tax=Aspergillus puulaauensis TaxID=1220207 RepID=A0A7R8AK14_9EURO|nr:uncharacterized protein APUU_21624A [Aspergillus puulaauensis]BCS21192.1 hypothetical protein APUU_21624A [Aspergillus puulaauensis]